MRNLLLVCFLLCLVSGCTVEYNNPPAKMPIEYINGMEVNSMRTGDTAFANACAIGVNSAGNIFINTKAIVYNEPPGETPTNFIKVMRMGNKIYVVGYGTTRYVLCKDLSSDYYPVAGYARGVVEKAIQDDLLVMFKSVVPAKQTN